jgi:hypothetical protein
MSHSILVPNPMKTPWIHHFQKKLKKQTKPKHRKTKLSHNNQIGKANCDAAQKSQQISL